MAVADIYEVTLVSIINGQRAINVQHFRETAACTEPVPALALCAMWEDVFLPKYLLCLSDEAALSCIYARRIKPTPHIPYQLVETASPGEVASHSVPSNAAAVLSLYTADHGRSGRGRQYISGVPESRVSDGKIESTEITAIGEYALLMTEDQAAPSPYDGEWRCGIFSPTLNQFAQVEWFVCNPSMGTIKGRRQPYGMVP